METIQLVISNSIATVRLSRGKANAINAVLVNELLECLLELKANDQIRGVLLTGHGEFFSAGLDVVELYQYNETEILDFWRIYDRLIRRIVSFPKPIVAAITGHCPAGGCVLALGCDYRVMSEGSYRIGLNEIPFGIVVPETIFHLYSSVIGRGKAYQSLLEGKLHTPEEALSIGLVNEICPLEDVESHGIAQLEKYMQFSTSVWAQSKLNFRNALIQRLTPDFATAFEPTIKQWWSAETRAILEKMISKIKHQ
jgi:enoyl-CoA hydratase/carnithine racemase